MSRAWRCCLPQCNSECSARCTSRLLLRFFPPSHIPAPRHLDCRRALLTAIYRMCSMGVCAADLLRLSSAESRQPLPLMALSVPAEAACLARTRLRDIRLPDGLQPTHVHTKQCTPRAAGPP